MATVKQRVAYIVEWCQAKKMPSGTCIALLCNIRAESGVNFNPQAIEVGSGAPPFTRSAQGYGLFQFSNYPSNQQIYTTCRNMSDKDAIIYQLNYFYNDANSGGWFNNANYPSTNIAFKDWVTNKPKWNSSKLTYAMMRCWERPADQTQNRYTAFIGYINTLYDFSKYDSDGAINSNGDPDATIPANYDCGGAPINKPADPTNPSDPRPPESDVPSDVLDALAMIEARTPSRPWSNSEGYQCVALMQAYLNRFTFRDNFLRTAWAYGVAFRSGLNANKTTMGLSPKSWMIASKPIRRGDVLFYSPNHVRIAYSSTKAYGQNEDNNNGRTKKIWKTGVGNPQIILRKFR